MTRVLIIDDHPVVRQGCRRILQNMSIEDICECAAVTEGYRAFLRQTPECVITDLTFKGDDLAGLSLLERIIAREPNARVIVFSMHDDPAIISRSLGSGASGYVLKDAASSELATALTQVLAGSRYLSHELAIRVAVLRAKDDQGMERGLSARERQVLALLGRGNSYDTIAAKLGISYKTVNNITSLMRSKLKLASVADLMRYAIQNSQQDAAFD